MNALKGLDATKGLDLILHTPGGNPTATEGIVKYLHSKFGNDIRVIVPQMAMSAGTMLACSANTIIMGKHSCLGPIDPQYGGVPAYNIVNEFKEAKSDLDQNPQARKNTKNLWKHWDCRTTPPRKKRTIIITLTLGTLVKVKKIINMLSVPRLHKK